MNVVKRIKSGDAHKTRVHNYFYALCRIVGWSRAECARRLGISLYTMNTMTSKRRKVIPANLLVWIEIQTGVNVSDIVMQRDTLTAGDELKEKILAENPGLKRTDWRYKKEDYKFHCKYSHPYRETELIAYLAQLVQLCGECMMLAEIAEKRLGSSMALCVWSELFGQIETTSELFGLKRYKEKLQDDAEWSESKVGFKSRLHDSVWLAYLGSIKCAGRHEKAPSAMKTLLNVEDFMKAWKRKGA